MGRPQKNFVWTPTKRRGPIAAEFSSPGPAAIKLPSTLGTGGSIKPRSPAFTLSPRHQENNKSLGPGPGTYNVAGVSKNGKDESIAASMHVKTKDPKPFQTPAPCDYAPEKAESTVLETTPKFSFGVKIDTSKPNGVPAPNSYRIPGLLGPVMEGGKASSPAFTISGRARDADDKMKVPGPGSYNCADVDIYKAENSPAFSMGQRTVIPGDHTVKPGPGVYCPEKFLVDRGPQFTMSPRIEVVDNNIVPAPGTYDPAGCDAYKAKLPVYTMGAKLEEINKKNVPAPGTYDPADCDAYKAKLPVYTMGAKLEEINKKNVPAPGTYDPADCDAYKAKLPVYTMGAKLEEINKKNVPAPGTYDAADCDAYKAKLPVYTMGAKLEEINKKNVPAPGTYDPADCDAYKVKLPVFTMGAKIEEVDKKNVPAPGTYEISDVDVYKVKLPVFTMGVKLEEKDRNNVPGPGTYEPSDIDVCKEKLPAYTMAPKTELPTDKTPKPAPNAYSPEKYEQDPAPEYSFGVKHSPYMGQLRDQ